MTDKNFLIGGGIAVAVAGIIYFLVRKSQTMVTTTTVTDTAPATTPNTTNTPAKTTTPAASTTTTTPAATSKPTTSTPTPVTTPATTPKTIDQLVYTTGKVLNYYAVAIADVVINGNPAIMSDGSAFALVNKGGSANIKTTSGGTVNLFVRFASQLPTAGTMVEILSGNNSYVLNATGMGVTFPAVNLVNGFQITVG